MVNLSRSRDEADTHIGRDSDTHTVTHTRMDSDSIKMSTTATENVDAVTAMDIVTGDAERDIVGEGEGEGA